MNIIPIFPSAIGRDKIILETDYKSKLIENILEQEEKNKNTKSDKAWTGDVNNNEYLHNEKLFENLYLQINEKIKNYIKNIGYKNDYINIHFQRSWATVSKTSQDISFHAHLQSHLSFAYYLTFPEGSGKLEFSNERSYNEMINGSFKSKELLKMLTSELNIFNAPNATLPVQEDEIYIFPSKLKHGTHPGTNAKPRISLSSDIVLTLSEGLKNTEMGMADISKWRKF
tara:strand:+ start:92 stop:775 length:684 start_codon:yes stop_codon:yes gene_type:complete